MICARLFCAWSACAKPGFVRLVCGRLICVRFNAATTVPPTTNLLYVVVAPFPVHCFNHACTKEISVCWTDVTDEGGTELVDSL